MSKSIAEPLQLNWIQVGNGKLTLYHRPKHRDISMLPVLGCTQIVTLMSQKEGALVIGKRVQEAGINWLWLPVPNGQYPQGQVHILLLEALPRISQLLDKHQVILIHCSAGIHRTGMLAYALLRWRGYTQTEALELIEQMRPHTSEGIQQRQIDWGNDIFS